MNWRNNGRKDIPGFTPNFKELAARIDSEQGQEPGPAIVSEYAGLRSKIRQANQAAIAETERSTSAMVTDVDSMLERIRVGQARCERLGEQLKGMIQNACDKVISELERHGSSQDDICAVFEEGIGKLAGESKSVKTLTKADVLPPPAEPAEDSAT